MLILCSAICTSLIKGDSEGISTETQDDAERAKDGRVGGFDIEVRGLSTVVRSDNNSHYVW